MRKVYISIIFILLLLGCEANKLNKEDNGISLPKNIPSFVKQNDIKNIDWSRKAKEFDTGTGSSDMFGNKDKIGIIGPILKPNKIEKWMWHFWGVNEGEMTVVGVNRSTTKIFPILTNGVSKNDKYWSKNFSGPNNGADSHTPSNVMVSEAGEWAFMVYVNGNLYDTVVMEIRE
ncbi:hypothetical protein [Metabacillus halosaccharovorans]|uniref:DUF4871 domain-containing protein n=1 Tax=Metabacillus halosaccharovorans TaxID=930124 RepID=A0ABT3DDB9_9BACI|nr:hypothetical protein [Metabacillus halosaccharovorans]MCV9884979.1 hypothetical protein [Metabacillus halosaccharovorans]